MILLKRREFLTMVAVLPVLGGVETVWGHVPTRHVKVEIAFRSPGPKPNGLQATPEGLWILDQGNNKVYLVTYANGQVLRALDTESKAGSGITFDGEALWIASTYSCEILRVDVQTGKTLARYPSPGSGAVKWTPTAARRSPLAPKLNDPSPSRKTDTPSAPRQATGAHGLEWKNGKLWIASPPSQRIYRVNPDGFVVEHQFPTAGNRPHGLGWEGDWLWCAESNDNAFYKFNTESGQYVEKIQLADTDPLPHGMTIWKGILWYCDDIGVVCRFPLRRAT